MRASNKIQKKKKENTANQKDERFLTWGGLTRRTWTRGNNKNENPVCKAGQDTGEEEKLQNERGESTVEHQKEALCGLTRLTFMHNSIPVPAHFNAMPHVIVYASEDFPPKGKHAFPCIFSLPRCTSHSAFTSHLFKKNWQIPTFALLSDFVLPSSQRNFTPYLLPSLSLPSLHLLLARVSPCSLDGCFLTRPTSYCLYLRLSLRDLNTQAGRLTSIALFASLCVSCQVELCWAPGGCVRVCVRTVQRVCALGFAKHVPRMCLLERPSVFPPCSLS